MAKKCGAIRKFFGLCGSKSRGMHGGVRGDVLLAFASSASKISAIDKFEDTGEPMPYYSMTDGWKGRNLKLHGGEFNKARIAAFLKFLRGTKFKFSISR